MEETAEKAKWCLCGVRKPRVVCLVIGRRSRGRAQGHRPEGFTGLCSFLCVSTTTDPPIPACCHPPILLPACNATCLITGYKRTPASFPQLYCKRLPKEMVYKATSIPPLSLNANLLIFFHTKGFLSPGSSLLPIAACLRLVPPPRRSALPGRLGEAAGPWQSDGIGQRTRLAGIQSGGLKGRRWTDNLAASPSSSAATKR